MGFDYLDQTQQPKLTPNAQFFFCKYCKLETQTSPQTHSLSLKMILQLDNFLIQKGISMAPHLRFIESRFSALKSLQNDFRGHFFFRVCEVCFSLHKQVLRLKSVFGDFAQIVGVNDCERDPGFLSTLAKKKKEELMQHNDMVKMEGHTPKSISMAPESPKQIVNFFMFFEFLDNLPRKLRFSRLQTLSLKFSFLEREYSIPFEWVCHSKEKKSLSIVQNHLIKTAKYLMSTNFTRFAKKKHSFKSLKAKSSWAKLKSSASRVFKALGDESQPAVDSPAKKNSLYRKREEKNIAKDIINKSISKQSNSHFSLANLRRHDNRLSKSLMRSQRKTMFKAKAHGAFGKTSSPKIKILDDELEYAKFAQQTEAGPSPGVEEYLSELDSQKSFKGIKWTSNQIFSSRLSNVKEKDSRSTVLFVPFYKTRLWRLVCRSKADLREVLEDDKFFKVFLYEKDLPIGYFEFDLEMLLDPRKMCDSQEKFLTGGSPEDSLNFRLKTSFLVQETPQDGYFEREWLSRKSIVRLSKNIQMIDPANPFLGTLSPEMLNLLSSTCVYDYQEISFPFPKVLRGEDIVEDLFDQQHQLDGKHSPKMDIFAAKKNRFSLKDLTRFRKAPDRLSPKHLHKFHSAFDKSLGEKKVTMFGQTVQSTFRQSGMRPTKKTETSIMSDAEAELGKGASKAERVRKNKRAFFSVKKSSLDKENRERLMGSVKGRRKSRRREIPNQDYYEKHFLKAKNEKIENLKKILDKKLEAKVALPKSLFGANFLRFQTEYQIMKNNVLASDQILKKKGEM